MSVEFWNQLKHLRAANEALEKRVQALEQPKPQESQPPQPEPVKRGPGRPRKVPG